MPTLYRFELGCGCFGTLELQKSSSPGYYAYKGEVDYSPAHAAFSLDHHFDGAIKSDTEPDATTIIKDASHTSRLRSQAFNLKNLARPSLGDGKYHKRIWRPGQHAPDTASDGYVDATTSFLSLQSDLVDLFRVVEPHSRNGASYGHATRELLLLACTEVELMWRSVLECNGYPFSNPARATTADYFRVHLPLQLDKWSVVLSRYPGYPELTPFRSWNAASPTRSLPWYEAYNAAKHDRVANFHEASFSAVLESMAALFVLLVAQFGVALNKGYLGTAPDADERRVFSLKQLPSFVLGEQYALLNGASAHVDFTF